MKRRAFLKLFGLVAVPPALLVDGIKATVAKPIGASIVTPSGSIFVSHLANGDGDGSSWKNAFPTLQKAIAVCDVDGECHGRNFYMSYDHVETIDSNGLDCTALTEGNIHGGTFIASRYWQDKGGEIRNE